MKYLTELGQSPAVPTNTVVVGTARLCPNPVKYFTVKKVGSLAIISQNPGFIEIQVLELFYTGEVGEPTNFLDQSLNGILHTKLDLNYQKKSREK